MPGDIVTRPDGRLYRSRKVIAYPVYDDDELICGVVVLGTHDIERARSGADTVAAYDDSNFIAVNPVTGWWRDGFEYGRRAWIYDECHGRAGVWFREVAERTQVNARQ